jgi:alpha-amylase/alpha-mannosidase (GH57 family)
MGNKQFFVHGHFYQPPREDAITGRIPDEPGAAPYRNWNERIHEECYRPNAEIGNFKRISFNIGPTLLDWMQSHDRKTYQAIIDQENAVYREHGVGNGMAQPYNHTILPLATYRDKVTQVRWGIADFIHHFGHAPSGMWLPETAVDVETLCILADNGIQFTILAPWQIQAARNGAGLYQVDLPAGRRIFAFVYDGGLSSRISFDPGATVNADQFILEHLNQEPGGEIVGLASDGELYGHHQPFREMFLAHLIDRIPVLTDYDVTFPAKILAEKSDIPGAKLIPNTSWSCHHGIARWQTECLCTPGAGWKTLLRKALDDIASQFDEYFDLSLRAWGADPDAVRDEYIQVILRNIGLDEFFRERCPAGQADIGRIKLVLKAQEARQKMFTSCGFFFDELSRIEPRNNIGYAAQAIALTEVCGGPGIGDDTRNLLSAARSQRNGINGWTIFSEYYQKAVKELIAYQPAL